jgi:DNA-binding GntR family transcriptional regulator
MFEHKFPEEERMQVKKKVNLKDKVYTTIKNRILTFELKPGEKILEIEIAQKLGVSRTPVREALNKLEQEGLISVFSKKGYAVSDITSKEIEELYEIREALEALAIKAAVKNSNEAEWKRIEEMLLNEKRKNDINEEAKKKTLFKDASKFHEELEKLSGNQTLQQILNTVRDKINRLQWMNVFIVDRSVDSHAEHLELLKLMKKGEIEKALIANEKHIRNSKESILKYFSRKKNFLYID